MGTRPAGHWHYIIEKIDLDEERADVRPTDLLPIIRLEHERPIMELRKWGFLRLMPGVSGKLVKKQLFNAKSETAATLPTFRKAFVNGRCLIPLSSWYEWPTTAGVKHKVEISRIGQETMLAAGLYETSKDFKTGEPIETYVMLTTKPNKFLGTVHDRAPLILDRMDYDNWLFGDVAQAQALCGVLPDSSQYDVRPAPDEERPQATPPSSLF
ncbi:MAG: SOS response-associated peptidase [Nitrospirota bacterium]|nr:SOS response-associated peptidase [Nitrospirota bacterium]